MSESKHTVAVDGATGFVGVHVVAALRERGHEAVALVRKGSRAADLEVLESLGARLAPVDLQSESELTDAMRGCDRLVHLIGSIAPPKGTDLESLHGGIASRCFLAAKGAGVSKVAIVTALGAGPNAASLYHRTKWQAEEALRGSGLPFVVLRPSLIVGRRVGHRDSKMVRRYLDLIEQRKRVPLVLGGRNRVQPIAVTDLAEAVCTVLERSDWDGRVLELGGGEVMTTRQFVQRLMRAVGQEKDFLTIPGPLAWCAASLLEAVQEVPLLSHDQLRIAQIDGDCAENALTGELAATPTPLDEALAAYA
ncbi:MAG: NAD(P)H-binding protein [Myxococcota bacterium]|nr:NAD(P)H-binding protein [Myxococcota bacterium]